MPPTLRTYCTGGDLFGVGAAAAGFRVVDGYEIDPKKAAVARLNGHDVRVADVTRLDMASLSAVDHEHWSPSCKTASQANSDGGETPDDIAVAEACARSIHAHAARGGRSWSLENVWGYRTYEAFARILAALAAAGFVYVFDHINMADYGVPQTRKRLILRAVHRSWRTRVPGLRPTHAQRAGLMLARWNGWYAAIEDLIPTLPETTPAPWQLQRMGRLPELTTLIGAGGFDGGVVQRPADEPAFTVAHGGKGTTGNSSQIKAFLLNGTSDAGLRPDDEPAQTVVATVGTKAAPPRAFLVSNAKTEYGDGLRDVDEPALSVTGQQQGRLRAYLLGDQSGHQGTGVILRADDEPAMTVRAGRKETYRAHASGRWVKITLPCLARFQTVPEGYRGLTAEINGNGVPCRFAQRLMESLL